MVRTGEVQDAEIAVRQRKIVKTGSRVGSACENVPKLHPTTNRHRRIDFMVFVEPDQRFKLVGFGVTAKAPAEEYAYRTYSLTLSVRRKLRAPPLSRFHHDAFEIARGGCRRHCRRQFFQRKNLRGDGRHIDIIASCRERLAHYKCPRTVVFGALPKTSTGKIQKFTLRE